MVGLAQLLLASCFAITRHRWHARAEDGHAIAVASASLLATLALPSAWLSMLLFFLYSGLEITAGQWLYTLLTEARGFAPVAAGIWVSVYWGSLTIGRLISGVIVAHISVQTLLRLCMAGALLGVVLLWLNLTPWLAMSGVALLGFALAPMFPSFISLTPARMGPTHTANTVGFQITAAMLGGAVLVSGYGVIAQRVGLNMLGPYLLVVALLLTAVYASVERTTRPAHTPPPLPPLGEGERG